MATSVTVLCPNGRRVAIKITPATPLLQVLEEACRKQKMEPSKHALKHRGKMVDLSSLFRYTNIPKNGHLEMVPADRSKTSGEVVLAVQCADGSRHQAKFNDSLISLWDVLVKVGVVSDTGEGVASGEPVVVYMNTHVCGEGDLRGRSLKDLGLTTGRAALRFLYRQSSTGATPTQSANESQSELPTCQHSSTEDDVKVETATTAVALETATTAVATETVTTAVVTETHTEETPMDAEEEVKSKPVSEPADEYHFPAHPISYFPDDNTVSSVNDPPPSTSSVDHSHSTHPPGVSECEHGSVRVVVPPHSSLSLEQAITQAARELPSVSVRASTESVTMSRVYDEPCERERVVYHLDDSLPLPSTEEVSDNFFAVTQRDMLVIQDDLRKQVAMEDAPLLTSAMRQVLKEKRFEEYTKTILRVHLPDRWVLQGVFRPQESLKALVKFIRDSLADSGLKFYLYTTPPKTVLKSGRPTFLEAGFVPAAIVHLGIEGDYATPILSKDCLDTAQSALQAELAIAGKRGSSIKPSSSRPLPSTQSSSNDTDEQRKSAVSAAMGKTVPKWFKLGK